MSAESTRASTCIYARADRERYRLRLDREVRVLWLTETDMESYRQAGWAVTRVRTPKYDLTRLEVRPAGASPH